MATTDDALEVLRLPLHVEGYELEGREQPVTEGWTRRTTVVHLHGRGFTGQGEDVTYQEAEQLAFQASSGVHALSGETSVEGFSRRLDRLALFSEPPGDPKAPLFRRWAFESAGLDLALRQAGTSLAELLGREARAVRFVVSMGLGEPPDPAPVHALLARFRGLELKLDPTPSWSPKLIEELNETDSVRVIDLKGQYKKGPFRGTEAEPAFYRRVAEGFPDAWIEDPDLDGDMAQALQGHMHRVTWDAPICSLSDIVTLPVEPRAINMKPSRFGRVAELLRVYAYLDARGIAAYGGGQFELGPGRGQIQALASLFHPDAPNDVAPTGFNAPGPRPGLPASPLPPSIAKRGFGWIG